jgi:hypothetical protein
VPLDRNQKLSARNLTNFYLGQVMVIRAGEHTATCRVLRSTEEMMVGDILSH